MSEEKEKYSLAELSEDAGLSWKNYLSKAIRKGIDVFARLKGQGTLTILDEVDSETMQPIFKNLDMKNQLWELPYRELEKLMIDMPPWHITSVVPPDIVQEDPKHYQFQFRGESINENDLFLLVPATDKTLNQTTDKTEHQAIKKIGKRSNKELHRIFWRAFTSLRDESGFDPKSKEVWQIIYDELKAEDQFRGKKEHQPERTYDPRDHIEVIDSVNMPSPKLQWIMSAETDSRISEQGTYSLISLPALLYKLKKKPPQV